MNKTNKKPSFSILPEKPDGAEDWFYTFMCMNIPFYGWRYLKQLVCQEPNDGPKSQFARAYLYYKRVFRRTASSDPIYGNAVTQKQAADCRNFF